MRALKSVLVMAGALKRNAQSLSEDIVLIRAMVDSNVPKFLSEDARLFFAIVQDLFPGVDIPEQVNNLCIIYSFVSPLPASISCRFHFRCICLYCSDYYRSLCKESERVIRSRAPHSVETQSSLQQ